MYLVLCQRMRTRRAVVALVAEVIAQALQITHKRENNKRKAKARETKMNEWVGLALKNQKSKCVCQDPSETVSHEWLVVFLEGTRTSAHSPGERRACGEASGRSEHCETRTGRMRTDCEDGL